MNSQPDAGPELSEEIVSRPYRGIGIAIALIGLFFLCGFIYAPFTDTISHSQRIGVVLFELYSVPSFLIWVMYGIHLETTKRTISRTAIVDRSRFKSQTYPLMDTDSFSIIKFGKDNTQEMCVVRGNGRRFVFVSSAPRYPDIRAYVSSAIRNELQPGEVRGFVEILPGIPVITAVTFAYGWMLPLCLIVALINWGGARDTLSLSERLDSHGVAKTGRIVNVYSGGLREYEFFADTTLIKHQFSTVPESAGSRLAQNGPATVVYLPERPRVNRLLSGLDREHAEGEMRRALFFALGAMIVIPVMIVSTRRAMLRQRPASKRADDAGT